MFDTKNKNLFWLLWGLLSVVLVFINWKHPLNSDEGLILGGAWRLWNGGDIYLDFFEYIPPASFYLIFWAWKIAGPFYWVARLVSLVLVFLGGVGLYKIGKKGLGIKEDLWCFLPVLMFFIASPVWPLINHNTFSIVFVIWALYFYLRGLDRGEWLFFVASGVFTGISFMFLQHRAGALVLAGAVFLFFLALKSKRHYLKNLFLYLFSSALPLLFLLKWPPAVVFKNLFLFPLTNYYDVNRVSMFGFWVFLFFLVLLVLAVRKKWSLNESFLAWVYFLLLVSMLSRPDLPHLSLILPIFGVLVFSFWDRASFFQKNFEKGVLGAELGFLLLFLALFSVVVLVGFAPGYSIKERKVFSYIEENCKGEYIYAGPFLPGVYFETGKHNPTFYPSFLILNKDKPRAEEVKKELEKNPPECAVLNYSLVAKFGYDRDNPVDKWLEDNYQRKFQEGGLAVFKLKDG